MQYFLSPEKVSPSEAVIRQYVNFCFRLLFAMFFSSQIFDFLFSPVWLHGYLWSLNQKIDIELNTKSAGEIFQHQLSICGYSERVVYSIILVFFIWALLRMSGFNSEFQTVWHLLRLSLMIGALTATLRCMQMKQRLFSAIHEGFYAYFLTFLIGLILTLQVNKRIATASVTQKSNDDASNLEQDYLLITKKLS